MKSKAIPFIIQGVVAVVVIVIGVLIAKSYMTRAETAVRLPREDVGVLVEVITVHNDEHPVEIVGTGQVQSSRTQSIKSEANGRVTWLSDQFYPGAHLKKGTVIAKINTDDYALKLSNAKIQLRQKEVSLMVEEAKGRAAQTELDVMQNSMSGTTLSDEETAIIRRQPQLQNAIADVELAKNAVKQAQLDYDRSIVKCPFDAVIQSTGVSIGDYISGSTAMASIVATDEYWVTLSLNPANVGWLNLSQPLNKLSAEVRYDIGGKTVTRKAVVKSVLPAVETLGRMVQVLLAIPDPLGEPSDAPLLIGTFVHASIFAKDPLESIELPRAMVREGNFAYVCSKENKLEIRALTTPYRTENNVYVTNGLRDGDRVVTTLISSPVEGRLLRIKGENNAKNSERTGKDLPNAAHKPAEQAHKHAEQVKK